MSAAKMRQDLQDTLDSRRVLNELLENKGWRRVVAIVQQQADAIQQEILFTPCLSLDSAIAQEYKKGQLEGRLCLSNLLETEVEMCEVTISNLRRQINDYEREHGTDDAGHGGSNLGAP